ncbi:MAG TPA: aconitase/3-isopropylmalate dehydratase large subunit family protein [Usitatibacter sp.]|nr:aconitase/3-isopropylmalate dehydratase large subunit family protein [Usitatibacter sp.]
MGQTIAQKVLARAAGRKTVPVGEIVWATPDVVICHDHNFPRFLDGMQAVGRKQIAVADRLLVGIDHRPYSDDPVIVRARRRIREEVKSQGVKRFFDLGEHGISHNLPVDHGTVRPGQLVIASDSRAPALGATGAMSIPLGGGLLVVLATGRAWLRVPQSLRVVVGGTPRPGVMSRDIAAYLIREIGPDLGDYKSIELGGPTIAAMDMDARQTVCNAMVDIGVKAAIVPADEVTLAWAAQFDWKAEPVHADPDAEYERVLEFDVSALEPQIALPPDPTNIRPLSEMLGRKVHQAFVGSCIGGKLEDIRAAANAVRGHKVKPGVRLLVIPATTVIYQKALAEGLIEILAAANADIAVGACGPCYGTLAPLEGDEVCIATSTRNESGRMGSEAATVLLSNAAVAAASAITGEITDPRSLAGKAAA